MNRTTVSKYASLLERRGWTILHESVFGDWQGDYAITLKRGDVFAFTVIGYGSCSGCDTYEALIPWEDVDDNDNITNAAEIEEALEELSASYDQSVAFRSTDKQEVIKYIGGEGREGLDWYRHDSTFEDEIMNLVKSLQKA